MVGDELELRSALLCPISYDWSGSSSVLVKSNPLHSLKNSFARPEDIPITVLQSISHLVSLLVFDTSPRTYVHGLPYSKQSMYRGQWLRITLI